DICAEGREVETDEWPCPAHGKVYNAHPAWQPAIILRGRLCRVRGRARFSADACRGSGHPVAPAGGSRNFAERLSFAKLRRLEHFGNRGERRRGDVGCFEVVIGLEAS